MEKKVTEPVYYMKENEREIDIFKTSPDFEVFKKQYEEAINKIIQFYNEHSPDKGREILIGEEGNSSDTVENMFTRFKQRLFTKNAVPAYLHSLYHAKRPMEEIAQSLVKTSGIALKVKLAEIQELAKKIKFCASSVHSYVLSTKLNLSHYSGDLAADLLAYTNRVTRDVIKAFTAHHSILRHSDIHTFNAYWNGFSKELRLAPITDPLAQSITLSPQKYHACHHALRQALTPYNITDQLAKNYLNNLCVILGKEPVAWGMIQNTIANSKAYYKDINVSALMEEPVEGEEKYRLRSDPLWLQVEIAKQLSFLPSESIWPNNAGGLIETVTEDAEGNKLQRLVDLFWRVTPEGNISQPDINCLGKIIDQVNPAQLMKIIAQTCDQDAPLLSQINPQRLPTANLQDIRTFFSKLGDEGSIDYITTHKAWFQNLEANLTLLIPIISRLDEAKLATISADLLGGMKAKDIDNVFKYWAASNIMPRDNLLKILYQQALKIDFNDNMPRLRRIFRQFLVFAIKTKNQPMVKTLSEQIPYNDGLLYYAVVSKDVAILKTLLEANVDPNEPSLHAHFSILQDAVLSQNPTLIEVLLAHYARDDSADALMEAIQQGNVEMVERLSKIVRCRGRFTSIYPRMLSLAENTKNSAQITALLREQQDNLMQFQFDHVMLPTELEENARVPLKPIGSSYRAILYSLNQLHHTSGMELIKNAFILKLQIQAYNDEKRRDTRRERTLLTLDQQINQALFPPAMTPYITEIIKMAQTRLPLAVELYQMVFNSAPASQSTLMHFMINAVKENAEVRLVDVKKIYHRIYQANTDNWDRNYTRDARKQLNKLLRKPADESSLPLNFNGQPKSRVKQEVEHQLAVIFEKGHQGMLLSYDSMMQYQDTIDFITKYIHELKGRGITTLCLPLSTRIKALIDRYLQGKAESTILPLNRSLRKLCVTARENDIKIIALDPPSKPQNIVQQGMADNKVLMKLTELSARLLPTEKFLAIYQQQSLLSKPLGRRFLPGIAPLLGLPALTVLSKKEYRIYFGLPQSESTEKNQLLVLNDISHRQERELSAPHLSTAKMFDASEWRKIPLKSARATLSSPLNSKIILVLENDLTAKEAGDKLFNKDPDNRALFYLSAEGDFRLVKGEASVLTSHVSILAVGHGRGGEGERNHQTLGGSKASALATRIQKFITQLQAQYVITLSPYSISLVGCSLTDYEKQTGGYARQFAESLAEQGTYADIGAYRTKVRVNESGHRLTELAEDSWHQNSADDKLVLRWNNEKKLVPANNLALRLQRARELIDELASNQKFYLSLNTQQQRDLSQVFQRPDGEMDIERMLLTTHHQDRRQTWNKNVQQLLQHPEIHTELAEVSLQSALRQRQHWHQRQQQSALAFYQTGTQAGITENRGIKIRAHLALQGLYISDSAFNNHTLTDSTALGLAWLDAYVVGEENTFFDGIKGHSEIKREKAAGIISLAEIQRADSLRRLFDDLQQVTQRNMAHQRLFTPQQKISNIGSYWLKGQYHSMMLNITANGSGYLYSLYDANVGVIHLNDSHSHENLSTLHTLLNDYLQTRDTSGKSRAQQYGMTERNNQYQVEIYRVNTDQTGEMRSTLQAFQQSLKVIGEAQHIKRSQNQTLWPSSRRRLDRINAGAHRLACGMQAMGYIIGIATIKKYTDMLNDVRLTPEQKEEIRFERNLALVSFGYNGITDPLQLVLSKVYPSIARQALARSMGQLPAFTHCAEKLGFKLKFAGVKFGGAGLNLLGTGFDIYQAYHAFSQISTVTDREVRQDLIVSGVFSTIGAIVGIVTSIAFMASATAAAAVAPLGVVIGLGLMLGRGIYSVVRQIEAIEKYITLDGYEKLANGWRVFWGMRPTADVQRRLAYERQKPIFLQHYKDYLFENARRKMMSNQDIDTYIYSLGDFDLQAHPFLNLVTIDTTPHGMLPRIGRRILKSGLRPEEVEPEKRKYHLKPDEIFEVEKTDEYYYTPGSIKAVDDTFNGAEWGDVITEKNHLIPNVGVTGDTSLSITERHITSVLGSSASTSFGYKNVALIDLGDGNDCGIGFANKNNIFLGGTGKKNYTGGQLHDIFYLGNKQKHVLPAPNLSSTFDGKGSDQDTLIIESKPPGISGYNVNLGTASIFYIGSNEPILAATLRNIEHIIAHAELNDTLVGDHHHNRLNGRGGNDILYGKEGNDILTLAAGFAYGGKGNDSYTILKNSQPKDVTIWLDESNGNEESTLSEDSNIILDYDVQDIDSIELSLNSHKIICLLKNPNGSKTTLYLNDAYTLSADGKELILKNKYSMLTHDGVLLDADSWPPSIKQQNDRWVLPPLPVRYVSSYDRSGEVLKNPDSEQNFIQLQQESGIITVNGHQRVLPKSMRLLLIDTGFNDSLEGDNTDNMLYSFGRGDRLKGSGGSDIYHLYHAQQTDRKIVIDNEDPRKMLDFLQLNSVTIDKLNHISKENNDIILSSAIRDPRIGSVDIRIKNFYLHDKYRHVAISDKESDRYLLDIDAEDNQVYFYRLHFDEKQGKFYCGQKQVNPQATTGNDILALSGAITLLDNTFNALAGNDEIIDQSHGDRTLRGGEGNDILLAGYQQNGVKTFYGDQGNDQLYGGRENDKLFGGAGKDTLKGNGGDDDLDGGEGDDSYLYLRGDGRDFITDSGGTDKLILLGEIAESDVQLEIDGQDLRLTITPDHLHSEGSISFSDQIEQIKVGQTIYNTAQLIQAVSAFRTERRSAYSISLNELITYRPGQWLTAPPMETLKNS